MAKYTTLKNGSSGDDVKNLQQSLINAGYNVGDSGADGIYGSNTAAAVKQYQQDNGLDVDGVAGEQTLGKLYGTSTPTGTTTQTNTQSTAQQTAGVSTPKYPTSTYDPVSDAAYQQALAALQQAQKTVPTYAGTYDQQLQEIYDKIVNRDKFSYDLNADAFYQQYADQYTLQGEMASMDTMGQAAALTGGYGNSYAQMVGQQTYQGYLQKLNEVMPELYGMALDQYNAEGDRLYDQYAMLGDLANDEYGKYQDALNQYWQNISYLKGEADDAYNRGMAENEMAYDRQQDAYANLISLITATGYTPTQEDLLESGMSQGEADAYLRLYAQQNTPKTSGGGSGSSNSGNKSGAVKKVTSTTPSSVKNALGVNNDPADGAGSADASAPAGFTGKTYSEAVAYMKSNGVPGANASGVMTQSEWNRRKSSYQTTGQGGTEVKNYSSYQAYLSDYVEYAISTYA